ncbi:MAG: hypothetical protein JJE04_09920 [Acidobacteriia bacterium]|nr:hypothetical protein [Terriglobia bacterium]
MNLSERDRRALALLVVAAVLALGYRFWPVSGDVELAGGVAESIPLAEKRLHRLRQIAATVPARAKVAQVVEAQMKEREKGLLDAVTAAQAQAQLLQIVSKLGRAQSPAIEIKQSETGQIRLLGNEFGEAQVSVSFTCGIEQLVNLLADISAQPEMIATSELSIRAADAKQKTIGARVTVSGLLPRRLAPERKVTGAF